MQEKYRLFLGLLFIMFFEILDNYPRDQAKKQIMKLLRKINSKSSSAATKRKISNTTLYTCILEKYKIWKQEFSKITPAKFLSTKKNKRRNSKKILRGGFYLKSLESRGEKPITGTDLTNMLNELQEFVYNAKYTEEGGFLRDTDVLISLLRGNTEDFKNHIQYAILPKYYTIFPPFLKWDEIKKAIQMKKYEDYPDYLMAYMTYMKSKNAWEVEYEGATPQDFGETPLSKFARASDNLMTKIAKMRRMKDMKQSIVSQVGEDGTSSFTIA